MPNTKTLQVSFTGGEVSPAMEARIDAPRNAVRTMRNWRARPTGAAVFREGFRYVNIVQSPASPSRVLPFIFSVDQALAIEMTSSGFRFHTLGQTLRWAQPYNVGEGNVSATNDTVTTIRPHHFTGGELVRMAVVSTGTMPSPLSEATTYAVIVVDANTIKLGLTGSPTTPINITAAGSGYMRLYLASALPRDFIAQQSLDGVTAWQLWDAVSDTVDLTAHPFQDGDAITFGGAAAQLPAEVAAGTVYYVVGAAGNEFFINPDPDATIGITLTAPSVPGAFTIHRYYTPGDLVYWTLGSGFPSAVYYCVTAHSTLANIAAAGTWSQQPAAGDLAVPSPYLDSELFDVEFAQSNDVLTLTHPNHPPRELRRRGPFTWDLIEVSTGSSIAAPTGLAVTPDRGTSLEVASTFQGAAVGGTQYEYVIEFSTFHSFSKGDSVYLIVSGTAAPAAGYWIVDDNAPGGSTKRITIASEDGLPYRWDTAASPTSAIGLCWPSSTSAQLTQTYVVTALDANNVESEPSAELVASNVLEVLGANNQIQWSAVSGAARYRVYKNQNGVFGFIGESETTSFTDDNIGPDLGVTPPILDTTIAAPNYPRAVGYFEQRRGFGGFVNNARQLLLTRVGTDTDLTFHLPVQDTDRIDVSLAAREAHVIQHIVSMGDLLLFTQLGEFRLYSINGDAITPETVSVRAQSFVGSNGVQPITVGNVVVFCAKQGGHVYAFAFQLQSQGFVPVDVSLRAAHLFDGYTIADATFAKSPDPVLWFVSSAGQLLGLTFVPDEQVSGWHRHDTPGGTFESVCAIPEGDSYSLYAVVSRTVNGSATRYIERLVPEAVPDIRTSVRVDSAVTLDGTETYGRTITASGGRLWAAGEVVTLTASDHLFSGREDIGNHIELRDAAGAGYRVEILTYTSSTVVTGKLLVALPSALRAAAVSSWAYCPKRLHVPHLNGQTVTIVRDGVDDGTQVVTAEFVTLPTPGALVHVGLGYTGDIETLPVVIPQVDGAAQGRPKNVNKVWPRVHRTAGLEAGPTSTNTVPLSGNVALVDGELLKGQQMDWTEDGRVFVRQSKPRPATLLNLTLEVSVGGS